MSQITVWNGPFPTAAALPVVAVGTSLKTMLQIKPFNSLYIAEWGFTTDLPASQATAAVELIDTGTIFGTVTASVDGDIVKVGSVEDAVASVMGLTLSTTTTGYTCTSEGSVVASRLFDLNVATPNSNQGASFYHQFPLGLRPKCIIGNAVRIRVTSNVTFGMRCWITLTDNQG